jgi:hypothetical protein
MSIEVIAVMISVLGFIGTIASFSVALGKRDARLDMVEKRAEEDRQRNSEQHREFYETGRAVITIAADFRNLQALVQEVKDEVGKVLDRLQATRKGDA